MAIQGLGNRTPPDYRPASGSKLRITKNEKEHRFCTDDSVETSVVPTPELTRSELLQSIRSKIKGGFYNSDAVLDDLSYGFAEALDKSV